MQFFEEVKGLIRVTLEAFWFVLKLTIAVAFLIAPIFVGMRIACHEQSFIAGVITIMISYTLIFSLFHVIEDKI